MAQTTSPTLEQIHALLAAKGYAVSEPGPGLLRIQDVDSGISVHIAASEAFRDFVTESNRGDYLWFVANYDELRRYTGD